MLEDENARLTEELSNLVRSFISSGQTSTIGIASILKNLSLTSRIRDDRPDTLGEFVTSSGGDRNEYSDLFLSPRGLMLRTGFKEYAADADGSPSNEDHEDRIVNPEEYQQIVQAYSIDEVKLQTAREKLKARV